MIKCNCWNPDLIDDVAEDTGKEIRYCNICGEIFEGEETPRDDVLSSLVAIREFWGEAQLTPEVHLSFINRAIETIERTE